MARLPSVYKSLKLDELNEKQKYELKQLEWIMDMQLMKKDKEYKKFVTLKITRRVPDSNVLFGLSNVYIKAGWKDFIISPEIDRIYSALGFWKVTLVKSKQHVLGSSIHKWILLRGKINDI